MNLRCPSFHFSTSQWCVDQLREKCKDIPILYKLINHPLIKTKHQLNSTTIQHLSINMIIIYLSIKPTLNHIHWLYNHHHYFQYYTKIIIINKTTFTAIKSKHLKEKKNLSMNINLSMNHHHHIIPINHFITNQQGSQTI